jgi:adenylate kinase
MPKKAIQSPASVLNSLLEKYGLNPSKLAAAININQATIRLITLGEAKISVSVALRFAKYFGTTPEYWLNLQNQSDLSQAAQDKELTKILKDIKKAKKTVPPKKTAKKAAPAKKAAKETNAKKRTPKTASSKAKASVSAKPAKKEKPVKAPKTAKVPKAVKVSEPKKRGRKSKAKHAAEPVQEKVFVPRIELIKKKDVVKPVSEAEPSPAAFIPDPILGEE